MWILYVLVFTYRLIIDKCINAPGNGIFKIDGIDGSNKTYLKQKLCMTDTEESNDKIMIINAKSMICDRNKEIKFKSFSEE